MIVVFCFICSSITYKQVNANSYSRSEIVMEKLSGRILHETNAYEKLPIASTTKIITAITVIENFDVNKTVVIPYECVGIEGSSIYLRENEEYTVLDLLYGLMLRSGNDCAETLATTLTKNKSEFIKLMNETAKKCGAINSNFTNPHGLHDENHYSTAYDLAKITCFALQNQTFKQIVSTKRHTATELSSQTKKVWVNKNKLLNDFLGATGVKTGFTKKAGRCLVSSAEKNGMEIISVVLDCPMMFERSEELLNSSFNNYKLVKIIDKDKFNYTLPDENGNYHQLKITSSFYYPLKNDEKLNAKLNLPKRLSNKVKSGEIVGKIEIYGLKQLIFSQNIYTL